MRASVTARAARLAVLAVAASSAMALVAAPARAASTVAPLRVGNDGVKAFTVSGAASYNEPAYEAVVLHANPANGHADVTGTVTSTGSCSGITVPPVSQATCAGPLAFTADTTNVPSGSYDVIETRTDETAVPAATSSATDGTVTVFAQPVFASSSPVTPASRGQNSDSVITVKGAGFKTGMIAGFGAGTAASSLVVTSPTQLTVTVQVDPAAATGTRTVTLTSPDDGVTVGTKATASLAAGFTINDAPTVTSAAPSGGQVGVKQNVTFSGTHLVSGAVLTIPQCTIANVTVTNAQTMTADVTPNQNAAAFPHAVFVTNPDGGRGSLDGGFSIIAPPGAPQPVKAAAGDTKVFVFWAVPAVNGSGPVTGYKVTTTGGSVAPVEVTGTAALITGLTNGTAYTFSVAAKNAEAGYGSTSAAVGATPKYAVTLTARSSTAQLTSGRSALVSGRLTRDTGAAAIPGATVSVRYAPQVGPAVTRTVVTGSDGTWTDRAVAFNYTTAVTATYAGSVTVQAKTTTLRTISVSTKVTRTSPAAGASSRVGTLLTVSGTTSPNKAGHAVYLYRVLAGGHLQALTKAVIGSRGAFALRINLARGAFTLRIGVPAAAGNTTGYSTAFTARRT